MTPEQIIEAAKTCKNALERDYIPSKRFPDKDHPVMLPAHQLAHVSWMLSEIIENLVPEGHIEKASRWLGFAQGVLWINGIFTIAELKNQNRPVI